MAPSCWFFWALWLPLMLTVTVALEQRGGCSEPAKRCGNLTISDPFWLTDLDDLETGRSCGSLDFQVVCYNNTSPSLQSSTFLGFGFGILNISYEEHSLHVVDLGKFELLHASNSCHVRIWKTSIKLARVFRIDPANMNLILYNCTEKVARARRDRELVQTRMRCGKESKVFVRAAGRYNETSDYGDYEGCDATVMPVFGSSSGEVNARDYQRLINDGFLLTWDEPPPLAGKLTPQIIF
ncbi:uncharacterized protein [Aegilops tauschii subsp. strangulata]|uniref:uncharacterized protein n=1 Tax=Aegilops tauschii subsp. strangulata TaxID=200361 RepID=UPI001E1CA102|nr:uncharacterized protein LOC123497489 [Aegilops tauschii subsp. strangulata]